MFHCKDMIQRSLVGHFQEILKGHAIHSRGSELAASFGPQCLILQQISFVFE